MEPQNLAAYFLGIACCPPTLRQNRDHPTRSPRIFSAPWLTVAVLRRRFSFRAQQMYCDVAPAWSSSFAYACDRSRLRRETLGDCRLELQARTSCAGDGELHPQAPAGCAPWTGEPICSDSCRERCFGDELRRLHADGDASSAYGGKGGGYGAGDALCAPRRRSRWLERCEWNSQPVKRRSGGPCQAVGRERL